MKDRTKLIAAGRPHQRPAHPVNHGIERASTYIFPTYEDFLDGEKGIVYGRMGNSIHRALEEAVSVLEEAHETRLAASGLQACITAILAFVKTGDHLLVTDNVYEPTRKFCDRFLKDFGVSVTYFDPMASNTIESLMQPNTKVIFAESPGSLTFEVQDLPALAKTAHHHGAKLIVDNTWAAGYFCKPITLGADVSVQSATKYIVGHADCLLGTISVRDEKTSQAIFQRTLQLGVNISPDDAWLALRGLRTLQTRLVAHQENGLQLAKWLEKRPEVALVRHPALKSCPGHPIWKRDFTGASGLFGVLLNTTDDSGIRSFFNALKLFSMGYSWGGFESLCIHTHPEKVRSAVPWNRKGTLLRIHAGLEDIEDMKNDLEAGFSAMKKAQATTTTKNA